MPFRYEAHHISGSNNGLADYLSRFPTEDADPEIPATVHLAVTIPEIFKDITEEQRKDPQLQAIINQLQSGSKPEQYKLVGQKLVYERPPGVLKLAVPAHMKDFIYEYFHTSLYGCHQGVERTVAKIKALFHWPALEQFVRQKIQNCLPCQRSKPDQSGAKGHLSSFLTSKPNEKLFIDVAGPLPMSDGYHFVFIAVDAFSRFVFLIPLRKATSETVIKSLQNHIFNNFGLWNSVCSDNDTIFTSKRFTTFLFSHGIHHQRLIRHYPNPNLAERQIKNMKSAIIAFHAEDQTKWSQDLPFIQAALNSALVSSTGFTPARIFLGRELLTPLHLRWDESNQASDASIPPPADLWKVVYENLVRAHRKMQRDYNSKHKNTQFSVGDLVLLKTYILSNKLKHVSTKLSFRYSDPYEITKIKSPVTYELKNVANPEDLKLAHVSQLKKFLPKRSAIRSD
ncbi:multicellular organismal development [Nesidiocoris tenuis]|uniref:RNA-directed DNA polymerase n=1 Tax=Nesidiocoris tenuis TaxID=355587 RepID=A0ABN7B3Q2_9HEMI|nr:multicellular organismal development [Nesidiocoris tenuis]